MRIEAKKNLTRWGSSEMEILMLYVFNWDNTDIFWNLTECVGIAIFSIFPNLVFSEFTTLETWLFAKKSKSNGFSWNFERNFNSKIKFFYFYYKNLYRFNFLISTIMLFFLGFFSNNFIQEVTRFPKQIPQFRAHCFK